MLLTAWVDPLRFLKYSEIDTVTTKILLYVCIGNETDKLFNIFLMFLIISFENYHDMKHTK